MNGPNPYAAPRVQGVYDPDLQSGARLDAALYTSRHVALATFLGTPLGGAVLMALNEHRLGRGRAAVTTVLAGLVATGFLFTIGYVVPDNFPTFPLSIGALLAMSAVARSRQGALVAQHVAAGGKPASGWVAAGIGIVALVAVMVPLIGILALADVAVAP